MSLFVAAFFPKTSTIRQKMLPPFYFENLQMMSLIAGAIGNKEDSRFKIRNNIFDNPEEAFLKENFGKILI